MFASINAPTILHLGSGTLHSKLSITHNYETADQIVGSCTIHGLDLNSPVLFNFSNRVRQLVLPHSYHRKLKLTSTSHREAI